MKKLSIFVLFAFLALLFLPCFTYAQPAPPPQNYVLQFGGDDVAVAPQSNLLNLGNQFTMETWLYLNGQQLPLVVIMGKVNNPRSADPFMHYALDILQDGRLEFIQSTGQPGSQRGISSPSVLPVNQWIHIAATLQGAEMRLYINGQQVANGTSTGTSAGADVPFVLGGGVQGFGGQICCGFNGYLRQSRVWNRALSGAEISNNAPRIINAGEPNLVAQWILDESSGQTAQDSSGNNLVLQLGNSPNSDPNDPRRVRARVLDQGPFFTFESFSVAPNTAHSSTGRLLDFDSDGDLDVLNLRFIFPGSAAPTVALRNNGQGVFSDASAAILGNQNVPVINPGWFTVEDFNGDGRKDVFVAEGGADQPPFPGGQSRILIQTADGRLVDETNARLPIKNAFTHYASAGDIDGDGDLDLFLNNVGCSCNQFSELYINDGTGHFTANQSRLPALATNGQRGFTSSIFLDLNGDNRPELILGSASGHPAGVTPQDTILLNNGSGNFTVAPDGSMPPRAGGSTWGTVSISSADYNNDNKPDLMMSVVEAVYNGGRIQLLLNNGNGTFRDGSDAIQQPVPAGSSSWVSRTFPADFNNDGKMDFITSSLTLESHLYLNLGGARFVDVSELLPTALPIDTAQPGDIDGDGDIDIFGIKDQGNYVIYRNQRPFSVGSKPFDFDGDGKTDVAVFRPADGSWWYTRSSASDYKVYAFGTGSDVVTPGDYTGDGKTDLSIFRPGTGEWFVQRSEDDSYFSFPFGTSGDVPAPADYDADGKTDAAVYRPSSGTWFILNSGGSGTSIVQFGTAEDKPVPADFDGDGKSDIAIFRPSDGSWWYLQSSNSQFKVYRFGVGTDKPVPGDYTGDGKADIAIWRPSTGEWYFQRSEDNSYFSVPFGQAGDIPAPGDYDGDGKFDTAVFRPSTGNWFIQRSSAGILITSFGANGDRPIPNSFVP